MPLQCIAEDGVGRTLGITAFPATAPSRKREVVAEILLNGSLTE
jgi:hypothetical protein